MSTLAVGVTNYGQGLVSTVTFGVSSHNIGAVTQLPAGTYLTGDPRVLAFMHGSNERALIASYTYSTPTPSVGASTFGVYAPSATGGWGSPLATATTSGGTNNWGVSNPWGLVSIDDYLYIQDYDSNNIAIINMAGGYTLAGTISNVFAGAGVTKTAHGCGMDVYSFDDPVTSEPIYILVALYSQTDSSYTYGKSGIVLIRVDGATATTIGTIATLTENAIGVTVEPVISATAASYYAFVAAMGGMQVAGGNGSASTVQVVTLPNAVSGGVYTPALALSNTITATTTPSLFGDFNDLEFWGSGTDRYAYVLASNFDTSYSTYHYQLIRVAASSLLSGSFSGSTYTKELTSEPAGATWLLAPANDTLWLVDGNYVHNVPSGILNSTSATPFGSATADATYGGVGLGSSAVSGYLNTASVVIDRTATRTRSGKPAASVSRSKMALTAEELKRRTGKK